MTTLKINTMMIARVAMAMTATPKDLPTADAELLE
jgi:hypothetical protein